MVCFGDGLAVGADPAHAEAAVARAVAPLRGGRPDLVCVFVAGDNPDAVAAAGLHRMRRSGATVTVGCDAEGVIGGGDVVAVRRGLGAASVGGSFASGETGPVAGCNHVHGFTASILAFGSG